MDFFSAQDQARKRTRRLVLLFTLAVLGIALAVYGAIWGWLRLMEDPRSRGRGAPARASWWEPRVFLFCVGGTLAVVATGSWIRILSLRSGGRSVAESLGGRLIRPDTRDFHERRLLNVVEEMALASGLPVPPVYVLDGEPGINAFAAGYHPTDAVIGVTRGCMQLLNRDELQGVIAHEFSHILNGDMRLNIRLIGWIFGILCLSEVGRILLRFRGRNNPAPLLGLLLMVLGSLGVFFGRLIQAAVSRQREYLADAAAVQFTRNPQGLAGALKKIGGLVHGSVVRHPRASEAAHLFFSSALYRATLWWATHPPLEERIRRLDPAWDGKFPVVTLTPSGEPLGRETLARGGPAPDLASALWGGGRVPAAAVAAQVGRPGPAQLRFAAALKSVLPHEVLEAARDVIGAQAVVLGVVLSADPELRHQQNMGLQTRVPPGVYNRLCALEPLLAGIPPGARLPLVQLALPALHGIEAEDFVLFSHALRWLMESDRQIDLFEYTLQRMVRRHLTARFCPERARPVQYYALRPLEPAIRVVLSVLARAGHSDPRQAEQSFQVGWQSLFGNAPAPPLLPPESCGLAQLDAALERLAHASPAIKRRVLEACAAAASADGLLEVQEAELLRAIADALDCPVPPFVEGLQPAS